MNKHLTMTAGMWKSTLGDDFGKTLPNSSAEPHRTSGDCFTRILLWLAEAVPLRFVSF